MGKPSRRSGRQLRKQKRKMLLSNQAASRDGLKLVVATSPEPDEQGQHLQHELELVRSALLYADSVELLSPTATMVAGMADLQQSGLDGMISLLTTLDDPTLAHIAPEHDIQKLRQNLGIYQQFRSLSRAQRREIFADEHAAIQAAGREMTETFNSQGGTAQTIESLLEQSGAPELVDAVEAGVLTINVDITSSDGDVDRSMHLYSDLLKKLLEEPATHLLFDRSMAGLARAMIDEGLAVPPQLVLDRSASSQVGTGLIAKLPVFPYATVSSVLEARSDLDQPLRAFRSGVKRLSNELSSAPLSPVIDDEINDMWRDEVEPTLNNLRHDLSKTRIFADSGMNALKDKGSYALGALVIGLGELTNLDTWVSTVGAAGSVAVPAVASAMSEHWRQRTASQRNDLFYLLELEKKL